VKYLPGATALVDSSEFCQKQKKETSMNSNREDDFATDDYPINLVPDTPMWSENYAFSFNDAIKKIGVMIWLGRWWADPHLWREVVSIALPVERMLCIKNFGRAATTAVASASMLRLEVIKPGQTFRLSYDGPAFEQSRAELLKHGFQPSLARRCKLELLFEGVVPVWNMSGHAGKSTEIAGALHIEQVGRGDGFIEFGEERFEINNAFTNRDHSRGIRIVDKFKRHCWAQGRFVEHDITFNAYVYDMYGVDGLASANASVTKGSQRYPAEVKEIELIEGYADTGISSPPFRLVISSELGEMVLSKSATITSSPMSIVNPWDLHHGIAPGVPYGPAFEEAVLWDWQGSQGSGWCERCFVHEPFYRFY
jgi:hypothetical protein